MPPHERTMLNQMHYGVTNNVVVASRGTAKSSVVCVLYSAYKATLFSKQKIIVLGAPGFRAGQAIFMDMATWLQGGWSDQKTNIHYLSAGIHRPTIINKANNQWSIKVDDNFSNILTLPTNDPQKIRGFRATMLIIDEANTIDQYLVENVARPFLNVKTDFLHGGAYAASNQIFFVSTIDYSWRYFQTTISAARESLRRDMAAMTALYKGDKAGYLLMAKQGLIKYTLTKFDYTDLLIREHVKTREGKTFKVDWPNKYIPVLEDLAGFPFIERDKLSGGMAKFTDPVRYYPTYPVDKESLEGTLFDGTTDESSWLAEQRNITDTTSGDVYNHGVLDKATCFAAAHIISYEDCGEQWQKKHAEDENYTSPVLWECKDPCVLGVDFATYKDFSSFVVTRIGPLADGKFDPITHHGQTDWSNVIWAEQHKGTTPKEVADKVRELENRYNLVFYHDTYEPDKWKVCRAIGLDMRGGGHGVRDELVYLNEETIPQGKHRIHDPLDKDERISAFTADSLPMLDAIWPQDETNSKLVTYTVGQMEQGLLYIGKYLPPHERPVGHAELNLGYDCVAILKHQLLKLRQKPTKNWRNFYMEGDTDDDINKKDLWAAFIYVNKEARAHIIRHNQIINLPPAMGGLVGKINVSTGKGMTGARHGKNPGTRDNFSRMRRM